LVYDEGDDRLAEPFVCHDLAILGTDGIYFPDGVVHPRVSGSTGRLLGLLVREKRLLSLEAAVRKLSGFPAEKFGLTNRGIVREGAFADLVVFDPDSIIDHATFDQPHLPTVGIDDVLVNGTLIVADGVPVELDDTLLPGRALKYRSQG
jgi:N-acyl-D-amino-acid deacylase